MCARPRATTARVLLIEPADAFAPGPSLRSDVRRPHDRRRSRAAGRHPTPLAVKVRRPARPSAPATTARTARATSATTASRTPRSSRPTTARPIGTVHQALTTNGKMSTTANVNLRKGAGTSFAVIAVIPSGTRRHAPLRRRAQNGFLNVEFNGTAGWSSATYLTEVSDARAAAQQQQLSGGSSSGGGTVDLDGAPSPDNAIARAKAAVGFSYYWGGGAWLADGRDVEQQGLVLRQLPVVLALRQVRRRLLGPRREGLAVRHQGARDQLAPVQHGVVRQRLVRALVDGLARLAPQGRRARLQQRRPRPHRPLREGRRLGLADGHRVPRLRLRLRVQCTLLQLDLPRHPPRRASEQPRLSASLERAGLDVELALDLGDDLVDLRVVEAERRRRGRAGTRSPRSSRDRPRTGRPRPPRTSACALRRRSGPCRAPASRPSSPSVVSRSNDAWTRASISVGRPAAQARQLPREPQDGHELDVGHPVGARRQRDRVEDGVIDRESEDLGDEICGVRHEEKVSLPEILPALRRAYLLLHH